MKMMAFVLLVLCVVLGAALGIQAGKFLFHLCPLKNNSAYVFGCFVLLPGVCIALVLSFLMPVIGFLASIGRK